MSIFSRVKKLFTNETISTSEDLAKALKSSMRGPTSSGQDVTQSTALTSTTFYACMLVLSQTLGQVPLELYRRKENDDREKAKDHSLYRLLHLKPNMLQTSYTWRTSMQANLSVSGNAYSFINRVRGTIRELIPIMGQVVPVLNDDLELSYNVTMKHGIVENFTQDKILHIRGQSLNGIKGLTVFDLHREAIGLSLATEKHGGALFNNGVQPSGAYKHPGSLSEKAYDRLKESLSEHKGAAEHFKAMILEEGMDWVQYSMTNEAAQYLETRKFSVEEISRVFRVPLILVGHADKAATYASVEQFLLSFVKFTMTPHFVNWEQQLNVSLLTEKEQEEYYFEFNVDGLLRGDQKTRSEYYKSMSQVMGITPNEIRKKENLPSIDGLDSPIEPKNITGNSNEKIPEE